MYSLSSIKLSNANVSLLGKQACVIGGTSGIGRGIAMRLAEANASVTIVGRDERAGAQIVSEMQGRSPAYSSDGGAKPVFDFVRCDAQLVENARIFSEEYKRSKSRLDILVMTQGIATVAGYTPTIEGIDRKLAIHYYGRVAFAKGLIGFMKETSPTPQVLSVLSAGVHSPYADFASEPDLKNNYSIINAANAAGFYNDIAVDMLSRENPGVTFIHSAPGEVKTNWGSEFPWYLKYPVRLMQTLFMSAEDCAEYQCAALFNPENQTGGFRLISKTSAPVTSPTGTELHQAACESVWRHTNQVIDDILNRKK